MSAKGTCTQTERLLRVAAHIWGWGGVWPPVLRFLVFCCVFCFVFCFMVCLMLLWLGWVCGGCVWLCA